MPRYAAVIFDLDGTLVDSESIEIDAGRIALNALGHDPHPDFLDSLIGVDVTEVARRLLAEFPGIDLATLEPAWRNASQGIEEERGIQPMPGAKALLAQLSPIPLAVASNSLTVNVRRKLELSDLARHFDLDHVIGVDAVPNAKPAPDLYLEGARRLGADPADCLAFEDSDTGTAAALAAGMTVVQVPDRQPSLKRAAHFMADTILGGARAAGLID